MPRQPDEREARGSRADPGAVGTVAGGLLGLAQLAYDAPPLDSLISDVLRLLVETLGVGVAAVTRLEGETLHIEGIRDQAGMGLGQLKTVPLRDMY